MQTVSSMNTSINTTKVPAIWNKINWEYVKIHKNDHVLRIVDYGCGKAKTANMAKLVVGNQCIDSASPLKINQEYAYFGYDPYWGDVNQNGVALRCLTEYNEADLCICANVLNVIDDDEEILKIINDVTCANYWAFSIYEGNKSGKGEYTKNKTCYQRNLRTKEYSKWFNELGLAYYIRGNIIFNASSLLK